MNRTLKNALVLSLALLLLFSFGACGGSGGDTYKGESASSSVSQSGNQSADIDMPESEAGFDGEGETGSYRCRILDLFGDNQRRLEECLQELSLAANKAFPPPAESGPTAPVSPGWEAPGE